MANEVKTETVQDILEDFGISLVAESQDNLEFYGHVATGGLKDSIRHKVSIFGTLYNMEIFMAPYWKWVDKGRRPGKFPPMKSILSWLTAKRIGSFIYGKGKNKAVGKKSILATNLQAQRSLAYLIARKIHKFGTKPTNFWTDAMKPGHSGDFKPLEERLSELLKRDVKVVIQEIKDEIKK